MFTLPTYLFRLALWPTLAGMGLMLTIIWLLQSLRFLDFVINKGLGLVTFLQLTGLLIPSLLTVIFPLAVFAGVAYGLKYLGDEAELTSLYATGWSRLWVVAPTMFLALLAVGAGYVLHMAVLPASTTAFKNLQLELRSGQGDLLLEEGTSNQLGKNLMVYLDKRTSPTSFAMLLVHDTRNPIRPTTWLAERGELTVQNNQPRLILTNGMQQQVGPKRTETLSFAEHNLDLTSQFSPVAASTRQPEVEEYSFFDLWHGRGAESPKQQQEMKAEAVRRLLWPLAPIPLALWAAAWLLRVPGRRSNFGQLMIASTGAIVYVSAMLGLRGMAEDSYAIMVGQALLPVAVTAFSLWKVKALPYG